MLHNALARVPCTTAHCERGSLYPNVRGLAEPGSRYCRFVQALFRFLADTEHLDVCYDSAGSVAPETSKTERASQTRWRPKLSCPRQSNFED